MFSGTEWTLCAPRRSDGWPRSSIGSLPAACASHTRLPPSSLSHRCGRARGWGREARERPQPKFTAHACAAALARTGAGRSVSLRASPACVSTRGAAHRGGGSLGRLSSGRWRCGSLSRGGYGVRWVVAVRVSGAWFAYLRAVACVRRGLGRLPG